MVTDSNYILYYFYVSTPLSVEDQSRHSTPNIATLISIPNPVVDEVHLLLKSDQGSIRMSEVRVHVYDGGGKEVLHEAPAFDSGGNVALDVSKLPSGRYQVVAQGDEGIVASTAFVIVR